jgi:hypothetical protein
MNDIDRAERFQIAFKDLDVRSCKLGKSYCYLPRMYFEGPCRKTKLKEIEPPSAILES